MDLAWSETYIHGRIRGHADVQVGELPEHFTVFGIQSLDEGGIVELGLAVRLRSCCAASAGAAGWPGGAPGGICCQRGSSDWRTFSLLLGSHLLPHVLPVAQLLLLIGSQAVPGFQALANLRLLFRRQTQETLVVPQKLFLPARRHVLQPLDGLGRQIVRIARGRQRIRQPGPHLRPRGRARWRRPLLEEPRWIFARTRSRTRVPPPARWPRTAPNWNRSFITWFLFSLRPSMQPEKLEVRKAHRISRPRRNSPSTGKSRIMPKSDSAVTTCSRSIGSPG